MKRRHPSLPPLKPKRSNHCHPRPTDDDQSLIFWELHQDKVA